MFILGIDRYDYNYTSLFVLCNHLIKLIFERKRNLDVYN